MSPNGARSVEDARVAVVHYWLKHVRGGEKVFFELARAFPQADLYLLHGDVSRIPVDLAGRRLGQSFLGRRLFRFVPYRAMLPFLPAAAASLDLMGYDLVVSSSAGWSHGVRTDPRACHISYVHSPPRYLWGEASPVGGAGFDRLIRPLLGPLRAWDVRAAQRVDALLTNSAASAEKIAHSYGRDSLVIHPPVEVDAFAPSRDVPKEAFVVAAGELVAYKRVDLAIDSCAAAELPLVVVGDGPERVRLERRAVDLGADVVFVGRVDDDEFRRMLAAARIFLHAGVEDFGITTVEALAAGTPVVGTRAGGTGEIVVPGTGLLAEEQSAEVLGAALRDAWTTEFDPAVLRARAEQFAPETFRAAVRQFVASQLRINHT